MYNAMTRAVASLTLCPDSPVENALEAEQAVRPCQPGDSSQRHLFWVRAVTRLPSGDELSGPWSEPTQQKCVLAADWSAIMLVGVVAGGFLAMALSVLGFFCLCTRTKRKWLKMRDIGVNLPSGLDRLEKPALAGLAAGAAAAGGYGRLVSSPDRDVDSRTRPVSYRGAVPATGFIGFTSVWEVH